MNDVDDDTTLIPLQQLLHQYFLDIGFELLEGEAHYRGHIPSPVLHNEQHFVFLSLNDDDPAIMSPFGEASQINQTELDIVRTPQDECEVIVVASQAAFHQSLSREEMLREPSYVLESAIRLGNYAASVEYAIVTNRQERTYLLERIAHLMDSDNWEIVSSGQVSAEALIADVERVLVLIPEEDLWQKMTGAANRAAIWTWAAGSQEGWMSGSPWNRIADRLSEYGKERGWKLT